MRGRNSGKSWRARWVVPLDQPAIADGVVTAANGQIVDVACYRQGAGAVEDLGEVVLLPGLINAHTHLEFSHFAQPLGVRGMSLPDWIRLVIAARRRNRGNEAGAIAAGLQESLRYGVTTLGEIATGLPAADATQPEQVRFHEVIGFSAARCDSVLEDLRRRLAAGAGLTNCGVSPHAPYSVHPELFAAVVQLAAEQQLPLAVHLAESPEELELLATNCGPFRELLAEKSMWDPQVLSSPRRPLDYLQTMVLAPRSLVVHGNYLAASEIEFLAAQRARMSVVYCPRTHAFFQHAPYPLTQMLAAGVRVVLGTDSRASSPDLSVLAEMRQVRQDFPGLPPPQILAMGTTAAAEALGLAARAGSLTPGKRADFMAVPARAGEPMESVLDGVQQPCRTWLGGREVSCGGIDATCSHN